MAAQLPAKLRTGDIQRFAVRAAQLEKYRPIVTYWSEYYILQTILNKNLHTSDEECANYAVQLMDKVERVKAENLTNDAVTDDVAAKAYIENFALETFDRGDEAQRANKVTKQTADTFMAAATFLDLLSIWGEVDKEITAKSKFAKFHALRIAKAFKTGEDPNATNPVLEEPPALADDGIEAEMKDLESHANNGYRSPTVEAAPPSNSPSAPGNPYPSVAGMPQAPNDVAPAPVLQQQEHEVSPIEAPNGGAGRQNSVGGGYFPTLSSTPTNADAPSQMDVDAPEQMNPGVLDFVDSDVPSSAAAAAQSPQQPMDPQQFYNTAAQAPMTPSFGSYGMNSPNFLQQPPANQSRAQPPVGRQMQPPTTQPTYAQPPRIAQAPAPAPAPVQQTYHNGPYKTDDEATMAAQKHARWAISALNFEDANTAVKELRLALQSLGAG